MQTKYSRRNTMQERERNPRRARFIAIIAVILLLILGIFVYRAVRAASGRNNISALSLPCTATQDVTPFGDSVLYYDGASIHCFAASGGHRWSFPVGAGARFSVSETNMVVWSGTQLFIVDRNGRPSYNENMNGTVQFARVGSRYCAAVVGEDTEPDLIVKNLDGTPVDDEMEAFSGMMLLDVGFYGEDDQYLWTLAIDVYGTAINSTLNTFQVGRMNTGEVDLGSFLVYKVLYENGKLRVFSTQQMYTFDYKAVRDMSDTQLVYGWQIISVDTPERGSANMLLAPTSQLNSSQGLNELRVLTGGIDRRYTLPSSCIGAAVQRGSLYAVSADYLYRADVERQRFYAYALPLGGKRVTGFIGLTSNGRAIVACGDEVYSVSLPR